MDLFLNKKNNASRAAMTRLIKNASPAACAPGERKITVTKDRAPAIIKRLHTRGFQVERTLNPRKKGLINIYFARVI